MANVVKRTLGAFDRRGPAAKYLPLVRLLAAAEIALMAREHAMLLDRQERRRLLELIRAGRGRRRSLSTSEREELTALIAKMEPRLLAGEAVAKFSPVPLPRRLVYGPRKRPS